MTRTIESYKKSRDDLLLFAKMVKGLDPASGFTVTIHGGTPGDKRRNESITATFATYESAPEAPEAQLLRSLESSLQRLWEFWDKTLRREIKDAETLLSLPLPR